MELINIEGWPAAGKTALWGMLDGSESIFVDPIHNYTHYAGLADFKSLTVREFRKLVSTTEYFKLEQYSISKSFPISYGADKNRDWGYNFDFRHFDERFRNRCTATDNMNGSFFVRNFILEYIAAYQTNKPKPKYFATMSNYFEYKKFCRSEIFHNSKTIVVSRSAIDIIASRVGRKPRTVDGDKSSVFAPSFFSLLFSSEIEEINSFNRFYLKLQNMYPANVIVITIEELIYEKAKTMNKVCDFLDIDYNEIFLHASRDGECIEDEMYSLTKKINDNHASILSKAQIYVIKLLELIWRTHRQPVSLFNPLSILRYLYLKFRGLR